MPLCRVPHTWSLYPDYIHIYIHYFTLHYVYVLYLPSTYSMLARIALVSIHLYRTLVYLPDLLPTYPHPSALPCSALLCSMMHTLCTFFVMWPEIGGKMLYRRLLAYVLYSTLPTPTRLDSRRYIVPTRIETNEFRTQTSRSR